MRKFRVPSPLSKSIPCWTDEAKVKQRVEALRALKAQEPALNTQIDTTLAQVQTMVLPVPHQVTIAPSASAPAAK